MSSHNGFTQKQLWFPLYALKMRPLRPSFFLIHHSVIILQIYQNSFYKEVQQLTVLEFIETNLVEKSLNSPLMFVKFHPSQAQAESILFETSLIVVKFFLSKFCRPTVDQVYPLTEQAIPNPEHPILVPRAHDPSGLRQESRGSGSIHFRHAP